MEEQIGIKLEEKDLLQLNSRRAALEGVNVLVQMAQREYQLYILELVKQAGIDPKEKKFEIDFKTGEIFEVTKKKIVKNGEGSKTEEKKEAEEIDSESG